MKRAAALLIALLICFSLCSCYTYEDIENARNSAEEEAKEKISSLEESAREAEVHYENRVSELEEDLEEQYQLGLSDGYGEGYDEGYEEGKQSGYDSGYDEGYRVGYQDGYSEAESACEDEHGSYPSYSQTSSYQPPASQNTEPVQTSVTVYITKTGTKYHTSTCSYLKNSKIAISKDTAVSQGYTACSRCKP